MYYTTNFFQKIFKSLSKNLMKNYKEIQQKLGVTAVTLWYYVFTISDHFFVRSVMIHHILQSNETEMLDWSGTFSVSIWSDSIR